MYQILLVNNYPVELAGLRALLKSIRDVEVCGTALDGTKAVALASQELPDVAIVDLNFPDLDRLETISEIVKASPTTEVLVVSEEESVDMVNRALRSGAR